MESIKKVFKNKSVLAVLVVLVIIAVIIYKSQIAEGIKNKGRNKGRNKSGGGTSGRNKGKSRPARKKYDNEDNIESSEEDEGDARELFNAVHDGMIQGMTSEEFMHAAGELGNSLMYIELRQLYNNAKNNGKNPANQITVDDYSRIMSNLDENTE